MEKSKQFVGAPRQSENENMTDSANSTLDVNLEFLSIKEFASILRVAPISIYRLVAKRSLPVYRACKKILFKRTDVLAYLEQHRKEPREYGDL